MPEPHASVQNRVVEVDAVHVASTPVEVCAVDDPAWHCWMPEV